MSKDDDNPDNDDDWEYLYNNTPLCSVCWTPNPTRIGNTDVWLCARCRADARAEIG